ncbi:trypsin-like peptidase domain-containing protein [Bradyrhizobium sp. AUGA SZCCT0240]|uniref:S1C family serine protease n=1 Tax=unclassified Bradyrhizobium TaxID=2631580 RepID=UPI001BA7DC98|nr:MULTISPECIES: trypsin-like peptidase domain-containing protein [unclassified Bradyrhizobium]MBR1192957.1 trypsin-like peptidase domain-containing protein [Bradyrhizobium sp. AUGA SZCCT0160]MBR1200741.1 trypsin-like peptidase domain-containing protein [Bradyrhizobium sp. AUGA SZCCT0158]MBR1244925.1 trypsin-like peptidase domain-containing protein [Bradyrhizobium sp. AUGA SZCCT0274]MBR1246455.1 trypsin-like peptidase domain-containing protein [Bradyrhizobium sp. AUGA SZCCT0169]MBR1258672.1 tr
MPSRFFQAAIVVLIVLLAALVGQPYLDRLLFAATTPRPVTARSDLAEAERATVSLFERVSPSVVQVVGAGPGAGSTDLEGEAGREQSGTGFVWDGAGHIVTNNHVVAGTRDVAIRFASGEVVGASIVGTAPNYDLAVVRVRSTRNLPSPIVVGSSADLKVGQAAFAIGNPFGLDQSLTTGVISALKRRLPTSAGREIGNMIQTDAAVNPGNSGGPLLDSAGRLIGVTTAIISPSGSNAGIGFAIPVDTVNRVVPELIQKGRVPTPGIGIVAANEAVATRLGIEGVVVVRAMPGSPAATAGLRGIDQVAGELGDIITSANGKPTRRLSDLIEQLEAVGVGREIELSVKRGDRSTTVRVKLEDVGRSG